MENTLDLAPDQEVLAPVSETVEQPTEETSTSPATPQEQLDALINRRMGEFSVKINHVDLKYVKNAINQKIEWKGPNEAYLVIMTLLTIDNVLQEMDPKKTEQIQISLPSSTIESLNFFLTKVTGKGMESAQKLFSISMMFRPAMEAIRKIDEEIKVLEAELKN